MERVKLGDTEAFQQLIEAHQYRVVGTVAKMLGDEMDAEDLAQQVFIRVWRSAPRYQPTAKFTTWLLKITRNLVFNEMRRAKRHPHLPVQIDPAAEEMPLKDEATATPDATLLQVELQAEIEKAIMLLPETQRMAPRRWPTKTATVSKSRPKVRWSRLPLSPWWARHWRPPLTK